MTSSVNSLPPPFANQALAQARDANRIQADEVEKQPVKTSSEGTSKVKPPAENQDSGSSAQSNSGQGQNVGQSQTQHVNIEA
jgi:hypothetical protein